MRITKAKKDDSEKIYEIFKKSSLIKKNYENFSKKEILNRINGKILSQETYIATENSNPIGFTSFIEINKFSEDLKFLGKLPKENYAISTGLVVIPKWRGKGIAKKLKEFAYKKASRKYVGMYVTVDTKNEISLRLQESLNLKKVGNYKKDHGERRSIFLKKLIKTFKKS